MRTKNRIGDRSSILPTAEKARCAKCGNRLSYAHFSIEEFPKPFCTWFCAFKYHQIHNHGVYKIENNTVVIVESPTGGYVLSLVQPGNRPSNHPIKD